MNNLTYEPVNESHAEALLSIWSDADVIRYTNIKSPCTLSEIREKIKILKACDAFAVIGDGCLSGIIGCPRVDPAAPRFGLFYHFRRSCWGQGFATAAAEWLLGYIREKYPDAVFIAEAVADNIASVKILRRLGFKYVSEDDGFERGGFQMKIYHYIL